MAKVNFTEADKALADAEAAQAALKAWIDGAQGDQALAQKAQIATLTQQVTDLTADKQRLKSQLDDAQLAVDALTARLTALAVIPTLP